MTVTTHLHALETETTGAGISGGGGDHSFLKESQSLGNLEGGTWRINTLNGAVEQRAVQVLIKFGMIAATLLACHTARVESWRRDKAENLARAGLYSHNGTGLAFHQTLTQLLQLGVDGQRDVSARFGLSVQLTVLVVALHTTTGVAKQHLHTFLTTQVGLVGTLHTVLADIITALVILVAVDLALVDLTNVAEQMGTVGIFVLAHGTLADIETTVAEQLLLQDGHLLTTDLGTEHLLGVGGVAFQIADIAHLLVEVFLRDVDGVAEIKGVQVFHLIGHYHDVVSGLVVNQQLTIAVVNQTTGGIENIVQ